MILQSDLGRELRCVVSHPAYPDGRGGLSAELDVLCEYQLSFISFKNLVLPVNSTVSFVQCRQLTNVSDVVVFCYIRRLYDSCRVAQASVSLVLDANDCKSQISKQNGES